jgi:hypothetical protein
VESVGRNPTSSVGIHLQMFNILFPPLVADDLAIARHEDLMHLVYPENNGLLTVTG